VYLVESTGPPVSDNILELLLLLDASRRAGAGRLTAVVPYFGYARQDRRRSSGEAVGARVLADALVSAGAQRLVVVDPHTTALEAMCAVPVEMLSAVPVLARAVTGDLAEDAVVVAPDLGAVKLAERYAALLERPVAVVRKTRVSGEAVRAEELVGEVAGRSALIVDDMISTGGTIEAAVRVLQAFGASREVVVVATHGLLVASAHKRLAPLVDRLVVTDSLAGPDYGSRCGRSPHCWPMPSTASTATGTWPTCSQPADRGTWGPSTLAPNRCLQEGGPFAEGRPLCSSPIVSMLAAGWPRGCNICAPNR
jgi:ribose-phosphate pyrophosphokinase